MPVAVGVAGAALVAFSFCTRLWLAIPLVYLVMAMWTVLGPFWEAVPTAVKIALPVAMLIALLVYIRGSCPKVEFHGSIAIIVLGMFVVFFWMGFEQAGGTMSLFADKQTDRMMFGWEIIP